MNAQHEEICREVSTYAFAAAPTFQLCCFRTLAATEVLDCVTLANSVMALVCAELYAGGILMLDRGRQNQEQCQVGMIRSEKN